MKKFSKKSIDKSSISPVVIALDKKSRGLRFTLGPFLTQCCFFEHISLTTLIKYWLVQGTDSSMFQYVKGLYMLHFKRVWMYSKQKRQYLIFFFILFHFFSDTHLWWSTLKQNAIDNEQRYIHNALVWNIIGVKKWLKVNIKESYEQIERKSGSLELDLLDNCVPIESLVFDI